MTFTGTTSDTTTTRIDDDGGSSLGVLLGSLGFGDVRQAPDGYGFYAYVSDLRDGEGRVTYRVVSHSDDGGRVEVYAFGWTPRGELGGQLWSVQFDGSAPLDGLAGFLAVTLGKLAVR